MSPRASYHTTGTIRDYDPGSDTCSVEFTADGAIDTWIDGVTLDASLNRAFAVYGAQCAIAMPDATRLCEATIIAIPQAGTAVTSQLIQRGRAPVDTDVHGSGSVTVTFTQPYTAGPPAVELLPDQPCSATLASTSATGFTASLTGGPLTAETYLTWQANGS